MLAHGSRQVGSQLMRSVDSPEVTADMVLRMRLLRWTIAFTLLVSFLSGCGRKLPPPSLALVGVSIVDIEVGTLHSDMAILVTGERITGVMPTREAEIPEVARILDGNGLFVIPGLWDMHVHALADQEMADAFLPLFVVNGITGIRDMGGDLEVLSAVRAAEQRGNTILPRIVAAGPILDGPEPVHPSESIAVTTPEDAIQAVDSLAAAGVDFIKVYTLLPREAYFSILQAARRHDLPVAGHIPASVTPEEAAESGQVSIEHLRDELAPFCTRSDETSCTRLLEVFKRFSTYHTPTLAVLQAKTYPGYSPRDEIPELEYVPEKLRSEWTAMRRTHREGRPAEYFRQRRATYREELWLVGLLQQAGIPILAGSDTGNPFIFPGTSLHQELEELVASGLTPRDALATATTTPARFLGVSDSFGSVREGYLADLVVLEANPLEDVRNTRRITAVVTRGTLLTRRDIDERLQRLRSASPSAVP